MSDQNAQNNQSWHVLQDALHSLCHWTPYPHSLVVLVSPQSWQLTYMSVPTNHACHSSVQPITWHLGAAKGLDTPLGLLKGSAIWCPDWGQPSGKPQKNGRRRPGVRAKPWHQNAQPQGIPFGKCRDYLHYIRCDAEWEEAHFCLNLLWLWGALQWAFFWYFGCTTYESGSSTECSVNVPTSRPQAYWLIRSTWQSNYKSNPLKCVQKADTARKQKSPTPSPRHSDCVARTFFLAGR